MIKAQINHKAMTTLRDGTKVLDATYMNWNQANNRVHKMAHEFGLECGIIQKGRVFFVTIKTKV